MLVLDVHLQTMHVVFIAIDDRPQRAIVLRPTACVDPFPFHWVKGLPLLADQKRRHRALDGCDSTYGFAVAWGDSIPDSPDVFPALPAFAVEERKLEVVGFVSRPSILDIHLVARLKPAKSIDRGNSLESIVAPRQKVPSEAFVVRSVFRLTGERVAYFFCCEREGKRYAILCVAVDSVGIDLFHQFRTCV